MLKINKKKHKPQTKKLSQPTFLNKNIKFNKKVKTRNKK